MGERHMPKGILKKVITLLMISSLILGLQGIFEIVQAAGNQPAFQLQNPAMTKLNLEYTPEPIRKEDSNNNEKNETTIKRHNQAARE